MKHPKPKPKICIFCGEKKARYPKQGTDGFSEAPFFCSKKCAMLQAISSQVDTRWCEKHGEWYDQDDCCECELERDEL